MFYIASAFLEGDNLTYGKHSAIISTFGKYFANTNKVPKIYHRWLIEAEKMRKGGDYNLEINISYEDVNNIIAQAEEMLNFATENL